ncbi:gamma-glutamylcyclotransferase family protein [Rivularia sp. UHCC 0363]|uniref:gamma-glutamylcyclotransferase family protein n=1 Tax=Rivularia sp. UHCC 0363 TaxID=3110244 RepID=UPI002B2057AC|nr:gamma-glutamylcyclotransferase [Rivularia sp. UHCC 0363]MEA5599163.1 gamma-glutamylcyclotransferase [Rivularia sp. UHCC 0363]
MCKQKKSDLLRVFVYGTLKPGETYYKSYCASKIVDTTKAYVRGELYALPQGYPAMTQGNNLVYGYLLSFANNEVLSSLDELEDYHPQKPLSENLYNRKQVELFDLNNNSLGLAWVYLMSFDKVCQLKGTPQIYGWWSAEGLK